MSEATYQKKIIDKYTDEGWFVLKLIRTNRPGIPDLLCLKDGEKPRFIECKGQKTPVQALQRYLISELQERGFVAGVAREAVDRVDAVVRGDGIRSNSY